MEQMKHHRATVSNANEKTTNDETTYITGYKE